MSFQSPRWIERVVIFMILCGPLAGLWQIIIEKLSTETPDPLSSHTVKWDIIGLGAKVRAGYVTPIQRWVWVALIVPFLIFLAYIAISLLQRAVTSLRTYIRKNSN